MNINQYLHPAKGTPYIEIYIAIDGTSLHYKKNSRNLYQGLAELILQIQRKGEKDYTYNDTLSISTPELPDTQYASLRYHTLSQVRVAVEPGYYVLKSSAIDKFATNPEKSELVREFFIEEKRANAFHFSDIHFIESIQKSERNNDFTKHGYEIIPFATGNYFRNQDTLRFYLEWYHLNQLLQEPYYINFYLSEVNSTTPLKKLNKISKPRKPNIFEIFSGEFCIKDLSSQIYVLHVELKKNDGTLVASTHYKVYIDNPHIALPSNFVDLYDQLYNYPEPELNTYIAALQYISTATEKEMAQVLHTYEEKKKYFYNFWLKRENDPNDPQKQWRNYYQRFKYACQHFKSASKPGWKTERGRVLLTYGTPDDIQDINGEQDKMPYQVWTYNKIGSQQGVIFVFYDSDYSSNEYPLLHSTLAGETYNANWRAMLLKSRIPDYNLDSNDWHLPEFRDNIPRTTGSPRR
ncbi:MAG: GWxTD domain-containing protein [Bacteroidia bacterium]|nr:GWxTD domain-containing protein [Bacteroidia bacterium]